MPGHVGVSGNARADGLAQEVAAKAALPSPVPCTDMFPVIREAIIAIWQERWSSWWRFQNGQDYENSIPSLDLYSRPRPPLTDVLSTSSHRSYSTHPQLLNV